MPPSLWPLVSDWSASDPWFATASALFSWLTALAVCAAYHRDAPRAALPGDAPGLAFLACCVVTGASVAVLPAMADIAWVPATCFVLAVLGRLLLGARRAESGAGSSAMALAVLGLLILVVRVAALFPWLGFPLPGVFVVGAVAQTAALTLLVVVLGVAARRDLSCGT